MRSRFRVFEVCLFVACAFCGCTDLRPSIQASPTPFFMPTAEDASRLPHLMQGLDEKARQCIEPLQCEQVAFAKALISLFESREAARDSFLHVIERNPAGPLVGPSQLWIQLIDDQQAAVTAEKHFNPWTEVAAQLLRDWMERQVSGQAAYERSSARASTGSEPAAVREQAMEHSRIVQSMQKQLRERDRQITALRSQLEALKYIDQEHAEKQRKVKPPASLRMTDRYGGESVP